MQTEKGAQVPALVLDGVAGKNSKELTLLRAKHCLNLFLCSWDSSFHGTTPSTHRLRREARGVKGVAVHPSARERQLQGQARTTGSRAGALLLTLPGQAAAGS